MGIIMILASILLPTIGKARESAKKVACASNLKEILLGLSLYAEENNGRYPPCDTNNPGNFIVNGESVYPEYIDNLNLFGCPSSIFFEKDVSFTRDGKPDPECLTATSYLYTGYIVTRDLEAEAGREAFMNGFSNQFGYYPTETNDDDIDLSVIGLSGYGNIGSDFIYRLSTKRAGIYLNDPVYIPPKGIAVISDQMGPNLFFFSHRPLGINVGYLDGHVEFLRYTPPLDPNNFPMSPGMVIFAQGYGPTDLSAIGCK